MDPPAPSVAEINNSDPVGLSGRARGREPSPGRHRFRHNREPEEATSQYKEEPSAELNRQESAELNPNRRQDDQQEPERNKNRFHAKHQENSWLYQTPANQVQSSSNSNKDVVVENVPSDEEEDTDEDDELEDEIIVPPANDMDDIDDIDDIDDTEPTILLPAAETIQINTPVMDVAVRSVDTSHTHRDGAPAVSPRNPATSTTLVPSSTRGNTAVPELWIQANGKDGTPGAQGKPGLHAARPGTNGTSGFDASLPGHGQDGADLTVHLQTMTNSRQETMVRIYAVAMFRDTVPNLGNNNPNSAAMTQRNTQNKVLLDATIPLSRLPPMIQWTARGGNGGGGGFGGNGGNGGKGEPGNHATQERQGTPGGPGGHGGHGGRGTSGGNGGRGGNVRWVLKDESDAYLLMAVQPAHPAAESSFTAAAIAGGLGGPAGVHGKPGEGGAGGDGGNAFYLQQDKEKDQKASKMHVDTLALYSKQKSPRGSKLPDISGRERLKLPNGTPGKTGLIAPDLLTNGQEGPYGSFAVQIHGSPASFLGRYDLKFEQCIVEGQSKLISSGVGDGNVYEIGDVLTFHSIRVSNAGHMPLPKSQRVWFRTAKSTDPSIQPIKKAQLAYLPVGTDLPAGEEDTFAETTGDLKALSVLPRTLDPMRLGDDFDPVVVPEAKILFDAFQLGPEQNNTPLFRREYKDFHDEGDAVSIQLRFPVENHNGFLAAPSLRPSETTKLSLTVTSLSRSVLGGIGRTVNNRRLAVRYVLSDSQDEYDLDASDLDFRVISSGGQLPGSSPVGTSLKDGFVRFLPELPPGESMDIVASVRFSEKVPFYSRCAIKVQMLVEELPKPSSPATKPALGMALMQSRCVKVTCEPVYTPNENAHVVLVTSCAVGRNEYRAWTQAVLSRGLGLVSETFSVSRYGSLDPSFQPTEGGGKTLRELFAGKLVVVINKPFQPNPNKRDGASVYPADLLPNGCMGTFSGFDASTRWLLVGCPKGQQRTLLNAHLAQNQMETTYFNDVGAFKTYIQKEMQKESSVGRVEEEGEALARFEVQITKKSTTDEEEKALHKLQQDAKSLRKWLENNDPLRQYVIEYATEEVTKKKRQLSFRVRAFDVAGKLVVRRGFARTSNNTVVVMGSDKQAGIPADAVDSPATLMAVAEAMSLDMRVLQYCDCIRNGLVGETGRTAYRFAAAADFIRDISVFLDAEMEMNQDLEMSFPSIGCFLDRVEVLVLIKEYQKKRDKKDGNHGEKDKFRARLEKEFIDLMARFESIARSKDLRPRFAVVGKKKKSTTLTAVSEIVDRLKVQWKPVLDHDLVERRRKAIKDDVRGFLAVDVGKHADGRWMQGLNHVHSTRNKRAFPSRLSTMRLIELDAQEENEDHKIPRPAVQTRSSSEMARLQRQRQKQQQIAKNTKEEIDSIRETYVLE